MNYLPEAKALVYNEMHFVSVAVPKGQDRVYVDLDRLYDEVSAEISTLYFGEANPVEATWSFVPGASFTGVEIGH